MWSLFAERVVEKCACAEISISSRLRHSPCNAMLTLCIIVTAGCVADSFHISADPHTHSNGMLRSRTFARPHHHCMQRRSATSSNVKHFQAFTPSIRRPSAKAGLKQVCSDRISHCPPSCVLNMRFQQQNDFRCILLPPPIPHLLVAGTQPHAIASKDPFKQRPRASCKATTLRKSLCA